MKDPLQIKDTPYELLGISKDADKGSVDAAFKKGIISKRNVQDLTAARKTLLDPIERGFIDIFLYDEFFTKQMVPRVWNDGSQLVARRIDIAKAWSNLHKKLFPYMAATHSLAVLWYWWACYCEEEQSAQLHKTPFKGTAQIPDAPPLDDLWRNAISYWVFLINSKDFWSEWIGVRRLGKNVSVLREKIEKHFINYFHNLAERYRNNGSSSDVKRSYDYELLFTTEIKTSKELLDHDLKITRSEKVFTVCCGRTMLKAVELLNDVQSQIDLMIGKNSLKSAKELVDRDIKVSRHKKLSLLLSPFAHIFILIENKKYDESIRVIEALSPEYRTNNDVLHLLAISYLEKGKQQFSLDLYDEGLIFLEKAIKVAQNGDEIKDTIVSCCKSKGVALQKSDPDIAIGILEKGVELTNDIELKKTLSVILCQRGIDRILKAQEALKNNSRDLNAKKEIPKGVSELKRAAAVDLSNSRAKEQLRMAEDVLSDIDFIDVYAHMNKDQWEQAIERLETILSKDAKNKKAKELLEICNSHMCWFCKGKKNRVNKSVPVEMKMHKVTDRMYNQIRWQTISIPVPRCDRCKNAHKRTNTFAGIGGVIGGLIGLGPCIATTNDGYWLGGLIVLVAAAFIMAGIGHIIGRIQFRKDVRGESDWKDASIIKQAQAEGWILGEKPPETQQ